MSEQLIRKAKNGRWRIGSGRATYGSKQDAERALHGYQAATGLSIRGQKRKKLSDMANEDVT